MKTEVKVILGMLVLFSSSLTARHSGVASITALGILGGLVSSVLLGVLLGFFGLTLATKKWGRPFVENWLGIAGYVAIFGGISLGFLTFLQLFPSN